VRLRWFVALAAIPAAWLLSVERGGKESAPAYLYRLVYLPLAHPKRPSRPVSDDAFAVGLRTIQSAPDGPSPFAAEFRTTPIVKAGAYAATVVEPRAEPAPSRTIIYLHGGAFVSRLIPAEKRLIEGLVERARARVVVLDYPLAPDHDWRDTYAAVDALWRELSRNKPPDRIAICGFSAGGGLALGFAQQLRDHGEPLPTRIVLVSPWLDLRPVNPGQQQLERADPILNRAELVQSARLWARGAPPDRPPVSPVLGSLRGLPPMLVFSGTADLLNADARALVRRAAAERAALRYVEGEHMLHSWALSRFREGRELRETAADFLAGGA